MFSLNYLLLFWISTGVRTLFTLHLSLVYENLLYFEVLSNFILKEILSVLHFRIYTSVIFLP